MDLFLIAALGFLAYKVYTQADQLRSALNYSFLGLKYIRSQSSVYISGLKTTMILKNPTNITASINAVSGTATMAGYNLGTYHINDPFFITANGSVSIPVLIQLNNMDAVRSIMAVIASKAKPVLKLSGNISTSIGLVPFEYSLSA